MGQNQDAIFWSRHANLLPNGGLVSVTASTDSEACPYATRALEIAEFATRASSRRREADSYAVIAAS